jgi:DHA1 family bicyclomycin/chloramphenicol resistance-like MFS transporter
MTSQTLAPAMAARGAGADAPSPAAPPWHLLATLSALMGFASISTDVYLPAMPAMGEALHAEAGRVALTISGFLVGFSIGQLFWGAVSDKYGRRTPVAIGLILFIVGSAGCAQSQSVDAIIVWRVVQALGACAGVVLSRAMVRDLYEGPRAAQMLSTLMAVMAIAPILGPIVGGQIAAVAGWRAVFWALVAVGAATLLALFTIPETLSTDRRRQDSLFSALGRYAKLLGQARILGYAGTGAFFYAGLYAYIAGTPFAFITYHHVPAELYGLLFAAGIIGIVITNMVNRRIIAPLGINRVLPAATSGALVAALAAAAAAYCGWGGVWGLFVPLLLYVSMSGFIIANSIAAALADYPEQAGAVSALVGAIGYGGGIAGSGLLDAFADGTPWPMGAVIGAMSAGAVLCAALATRR